MSAVCWLAREAAAYRGSQALLHLVAWFSQFQLALQHLVGKEGGIVLRPVDEQKAEEDDEGHGEEDGAVEDVLPHRELPHQLDITVQYNTALDISANRSNQSNSFQKWMI